MSCALDLVEHLYTSTIAATDSCYANCQSSLMALRSYSESDRLADSQMTTQTPEHSYLCYSSTLMTMRQALY